VGSYKKAMRQFCISFDTIAQKDGWFRVMYVAKFPEAVYVLHCFKKKTSATSKHDKEIATARYKAVVQERNLS
jgi:phage-related protein